MKKFLLYLMTFTMLSLLMAGCSKDTVEFFPDNSATVKSDLFITVLDEQNEPIEGAGIQFGGHNYTTDKYGVVYLKGQNVSTRHSHINVEKAGYFSTARVFSATTQTTVHVRVRLFDRKFQYTFPAEAGGTINTPEKIQLIFPAQAIKLESSGQPYNGTVEMAVRYIDPTAPDLVERMPGDLSAISAANQLSVLETFGMVQVELRSPSGQKLNIRDGVRVEMAVNIPGALLSNAKPAIPMWTFDPTTGYWREEGSAQKEGDRYIASVTHFSYWNYDFSAPSVQVTGRLVDQNGTPLGNLYVSMHGQGSGSGGHGYSHADGTFGGNVESNVLLDLLVKSNQGNCNNQVIYSQVIGPFSVDTDLGDITVTIPPAEQLTITATIVDCDGQPVTDGFLKADIGASYPLYLQPDASGSVSYTGSVCGDYPGANVVAVDLINLKQSDAVGIDVPGTNNLGNIAACGNDIENLMVNIPDEGLNNFVIFDSIGLSRTNQFKYFYGQSYNPAGPFSVSVTGKYSDGNNDGYTSGTYSMISFKMVIFNSGTGKEVTDNNVTITITQGGNPGDKIIATYSGTVTFSDNPTPHNVNGSFYLTGQ